MNKGYSTRDMAEDLAFGMQTLGITRAKVLGVSQGGMIAQYLAIDHPELVDRLVLAVTLSRPNETARLLHSKTSLILHSDEILTI